jgi:glycosyltransferase involved in cell wall biosynthesis
MKYPLVSILMPVYSPRFFEEALLSAINQSYEFTEIIVSDDSPDENIKLIVDRYLSISKNITYVKNNPPQGPVYNYGYSLSLAKGEYIKFLNDDDLLEKSCIQKMVSIMNDMPSIVLVTSARECVDDVGHLVTGHMSTNRIIKESCILHGLDFVSSMIKLRLNLIGEPTTAMFRRDCMKSSPMDLMSWDGKTVIPGDVTIWIKLLQEGNLYYFAEKLSSFRLHAGQWQHTKIARNSSHEAWEWFRSYGKKTGAYSKGLGWFVRAKKIEENEWQLKKIASTKMIFRQLLLPFFRVYMHYASQKNNINQGL